MKIKVKLKQKETLVNLYNEDVLRDISMYESFYTIRTLKALIESITNGTITNTFKENFKKFEI